MYAKIAALLALAACACAQPQLNALNAFRYPQYVQPGVAASARILSQSNEVNPDGTFSYSYQTENGIAAQAQGGTKNLGRADLEAQTVQGSYSWTSPEGQQFTVQYIADENGYQPVGAHLPTPPPIPEAILRSLEFNARNPEPEDRPVFIPTPTQNPFLFRRP